MAESISVEIRSNVDRLSAEAIKREFVRSIDSSARDGGEFLKAIVPKDTGALSEHAGHRPAVTLGDIIQAAVGVARIETASATQGGDPGYKDLIAPGEQNAGDYPIFRDRGTGIFGPAASPIFARRARYMKFPGEGGVDIFRKEVRGSPGAHFMLATFAELQLIVRARIKEFEAAVKGGDIFAATGE